MDDESIRKKLAKRTQYSSRLNALEAWERVAPKKDRKTFEAYVRNWLEMKSDGHPIGWKAFCELCVEDIPTFNMGSQALKGALFGRIKKL